MLYEISQLEIVEKDILINHIIKSTLFMFILLLIVIIIIILFYVYFRLVVFLLFHDVFN